MAKSRAKPAVAARSAPRKPTPKSKKKAVKPAAKSSASFTWRHLKLRAVHTPNYINQGWSHIELHVLAPKGAPCPLTATGYRSHFLDGADLRKTGGVVAFFTAWLDREAATKAWARCEAKWRQLDLFG